MKFSRTVLAACFAVVGGSQVQVSSGEDRTITKVVKMLEGMVAQSKADGDLDRKLYAKFLCYCNSKKATKTKEIDDLAMVIALLENKIAELRGSTAEESSAVAKLKAEMADNLNKQAQATQLRTNENTDYLAMKADSELAISQMVNALNTLAEVGADQTAGAAADHNQFMAKYGVLLQAGQAAKLHKALAAAAALMEPARASAVHGFLQAPFTGTYTSQAGEVVGILKQMRETFEKNLADATAAEEASLAAHNKLFAELTAAHAEMQALYNEKQALIGSNDDALSTATTNLAEANSEKATREEFMGQLIPMCTQKAQEYEQRNVMRADEDAAISQAISILDSDAAFASFGKTDATSTGATGPASFMQRGLIRQHTQDVRVEVQRILQKAARSQRSLRLAKIIALLEAGNPFTKVLEAMENLITLIVEEGTADADKLSWCNSERTTNDQKSSDLDTGITELSNSIAALDGEIEAPETGLKDQIASTETSLKDNYNSQQTQTEQRTEENQAYQTDIQNLVDAQSLVTSAINVLTKYYEKIPTTSAAPQAAVVMAGDTDAVPVTHEDAGHQGQATAGNNVIQMLTYIRTNAKSEETAAHTAERDSQHSFEDSMTQLKSEEATLQSSLASLKETLAEKEKERFEQQGEKKAAEDNNAAVQAYLASIKSECDFITENIQHRNDRRASEKGALENAIALIKDTPVYKTAVANAHLESLGGCKDICVEAGEEHVKCKACLANVEIPGYCAGHPGTEGC